ncbi:GDP-mannose transporter GONST3 [Spatholobus suberectus]|nr:GDP-mannose transporter GONST3 [Spatholobus suberectus]
MVTTTMMVVAMVMLTMTVVAVPKAVVVTVPVVIVAVPLVMVVAESVVIVTLLVVVAAALVVIIMVVVVAVMMLMVMKLVVVEVMLVVMVVVAPVMGGSCSNSDGGGDASGHGSCDSSDGGASGHGGSNGDGSYGDSGNSSGGDDSGGDNSGGCGGGGEEIQRKQNRRRGSVVCDNDEPLFHSILMSKDTDVENPSNNLTVEKGVGVNVSDGEGNWYTSLVHQISVYGVAAGYCLSASLLSIINKWAVMKFPYPGALTALQYFTSAAGVFLSGRLKLLEHDRLDLMTMWRFLPAAIIFYLSLFTNSELLLHANVDTFIVFRSVVPLFVAVGETLFLHQPWPSAGTWASLSTIFAGSVLYVATDYQFTFMAYSWALAYLVSMTIDFVYIKHVVMTIGLNTWGLVLYNNLEALLLFPLELLIMGELKKIKHEINDESDWHSFQVVLPVGLSCLFGLSISFFGFSCRRAISATGFTVLGIVNKLLTVVINLVIWDKHSTWVGTVGLLICMLGGIMYQQSTSKPKAAKQVSAQENEEEQQKLLEMQANSETNINNNEVNKPREES